MADIMARIVRTCLIAIATLALWGSFAAAPTFAQTPPDGCSPLPPPQPVDFSREPNLDLIKAQLLYYRCARYDADITAVLTEAKAWVALRAPQVAKPAIVLDIDETSLSNWPRIYKNNFAFFADGHCNFADPHEACGEGEWEESEKAPAIAPTLDLYKFARCIGALSPCREIEVFFVTGRGVNAPKVHDRTSTEWTLANLDGVGYKGLSPDRLYMRPADSSGPVARYKTWARTDIEQRFKVTIIANIGDQQSDLDGGHADRTFKLPNPFYFIP